jgi:hypothetical protein
MAVFLVAEGQSTQGPRLTNATVCEIIDSNGIIRVVVTIFQNEVRAWFFYAWNVSDGINDVR